MTNTIYSREDFNDDVIFTVNGESYTSKELMLVIPNGYKHIFNGAKFEDMTMLSRMVACARVAFEARIYGVAHRVRECEVALSRIPR